VIQPTKAAVPSRDQQERSLPLPNQGRDHSDGLISESRRCEESIPYDLYRAARLKRASVGGATHPGGAGCQPAAGLQSRSANTREDLNRRNEFRLQTKVRATI
jgi:hypothetical protein